MEVLVETKVCKKCSSEIKNEDDIYESYRTVCKNCVNKRSRDFYWAHRKEILISRNKDRQLRKKRIEKRPEGFYYLKIALPVYCTPIVVNEEVLKVEEVKCNVDGCTKILTMSEKLYGDYCIKHTQGQTENVFKKEQLYIKK